MDVLHSEKVVLRKPTTEDKEELFSILNDEEVKKYVSGLYVKKLEDVDLILDIADSMDVIFFVIKDQQTKELVGIVMVYKSFTDEGICSYITKKEHRSKGIISESLKIFCKYLYVIKFAKNLTFEIKPDNIASLTLMSKLRIPFSYFDGSCFHYDLSLEKEPSF